MPTSRLLLHSLSHGQLILQAEAPARNGASRFASLLLFDPIMSQAARKMGMKSARPRYDVPSVRTVLICLSRCLRARTQLGTARLLLVALLALAGAAGCSKHPSLAPIGFLQVDIGTAPTELDPRLATDAISSRIDELIYEPMVRLDRSGWPVGILTERVERSSDTRLIFHLRRGIHFSDGRQLTARDVVYTYRSILDPATHSSKAAGLRQMESIEALDNYTVILTTRGPYAAALELATYDVIPDRSALPGPEGRDWLGRGSTIAPPGTGPFRPIRFGHDAAVVLGRNLYRGHDLRSAPGIVFKIVPDATVRALELTEGICDFAENDAVQPDLIPYLAAQPGLRVDKSPGLFFQHLVFNFRDARLRDVRLRRAIAYAIDRNAIVHSMLRDAARTATGMLPPENWAYESDVLRYPYNPAASRRMLEAAGYVPGEQRLHFVYKTTPEGRRLAEAIQAMLKRIGITVDIHTNEWATFFSDLRSGNFDLAASQISAMAPEEYFLFLDSRMMPPYGNDRGAYEDPQMDRLLETAQVTLDSGRRRMLYSAVQKLAASDLPYVPLWWMDTVTVMTRRIAGFEPYPNGNLISLANAAYAPSATSGN
jgi:peptide/nickel transport system substrate-binding protein